MTYMLTLEAKFEDKLFHVVPDGEHTGGKCWMYMHMPKSGGTTVIRMLQKNWGDRLFLYGSGQWARGDKSLRLYADKFKYEFENGRKNVIVGSYIDAFENYDIGEMCQRFTVFRNPISRMVSAYYYCKVNGRDSLCATEVVSARDVDLLTFAKHWGNFAMRQFLISSVSYDDVLEYSNNNSIQYNAQSWYKMKKYMESTQMSGYNIPEMAMYDMIQPVQDLISEKYVVGILEDFNSTMSLFDKELHMPVVDWSTEYNNQGLVNSNTKFDVEKKIALMDAHTSSEIKKYMQVDIILYEHAVSVFNAQVKANGIIV